MNRRATESGAVSPMNPITPRKSLFDDKKVEEKEEDDDTAFMK